MTAFNTEAPSTLAPMRFVELCQKADTFARWHRGKYSASAQEHFLEDWQTFTAKLKKNGEQFSEFEWSIMLVHAQALLHYDNPNHGTTRQRWRSGGLWSENSGWGNTS